jgi:type IV secretory pathway VirB2 component (pilin)
MRRTDKLAGLLRTCSLPLIMMSANVMAADGGPFSTALNSFVDIFFDWATPLAIIGITVVGLLALFGVLRATLAVYAVWGIVIVFGAPQLVAWVRGIGGV